MMDSDDLRARSRPFRQGYGAHTIGRDLHANPYLPAADLAETYEAVQWLEGWKEADRDKRIKAKIDEMSREIERRWQKATKTKPFWLRAIEYARSASVGVGFQ